MARTDFERYQAFKKRNKLTYSKIKKIATEYAKTDDEMARSFFTDQYNISAHVFYTLLSFAIICWIVDDDTRKKIKKKAVSNYKLHNEKEKAKRVMDHYADLYRKRQVFLNHFSKEEIIDISKKYSEGIALGVIAKEYEVCKDAIRILLARGIKNVITPSNIVAEMKKRSQAEGKSMVAFQKLELEREVTKLRALKPFEDEIIMLKFQIKNYDEYYDGDEYCPGKDYLENRLGEIVEKFCRLLDF